MASVRARPAEGLGFAGEGDLPVVGAQTGPSKSVRQLGPERRWRTRPGNGFHHPSLEARLQLPQLLHGGVRLVDPAEHSERGRNLHELAD
jgi:hypothetical protein